STSTAATSRRSNSRLPTTLNARDQPPAEVSDQRVSGLTGAVQHGLIPLFCHTQLLHRRSVKDQPNQLSSISRNIVRHHPNPKRQASAEVLHERLSPLSGLN
ncbi:hypothetical protein C9I79_04150, partial [Mycobacterium tuberculosis]